MTLNAVPIAGSTYKNLAEIDRRLTTYIFGKVPGILSGFTFAPGAGMTLIMQPGDAAVRGRSSSSQGFYFVSDSAAQTINWPVAAASPRIDALVLAVGDTQYGAVGGALGGTSGPAFIVVQGTPNASPVAPTDADITTAVGAGGWERFANIRINNGDTTINPANITNTLTTVTPPVVQAFISAAQTHNSGSATWDPILLDGLSMDTDGMWSSGATDRFTIKTAGKYRINGCIAFVSNSSGARAGRVKVNGVEVCTAFAVPNAVGAAGFVVLPPVIQQLAVNDIITFDGWQNAGATLDYHRNGTAGSFINLERVGS